MRCLDGCAVGSGVQILAMTLCTMVCAIFGLTSPGNRGGLLTTLLILFVFMGSFAGYCSARVYKLFGGKEWKKNTVMTAMFYPGVMGSIFLFINSFVAYYGSSAAAPLTTLLALILLWFGISTPMVFVAATSGSRRRHEVFSLTYFQALGGILPFGPVTMELFFIISSMSVTHRYGVSA